MCNPCIPHRIRCPSRMTFSTRLRHLGCQAFGVRRDEFQVCPNVEIRSRSAVSICGIMRWKRPKLSSTRRTRWSYSPASLFRVQCIFQFINELATVYRFDIPYRNQMLYHLREGMQMRLLTPSIVTEKKEKEKRKKEKMNMQC